MAQPIHNNTNGPAAPTPAYIQVLFVTAFAIAAVILAKLKLQTGVSDDLLPAWIAAELFRDQQWQYIYSNDAGHFRMTSPEQWAPYLNAHGFDAPVYPYVYPPLWAALLAPVTQIIDYSTFDWVIGAINPVLIVLMPYFAWRAAPMVAMPLHMVLALLVILTSSIGIIALIGNQAQILTALLTILAVERSRNGHPITAGTVLALAAALKIYPAIFALLFLATRQFRAVAAFMVAGISFGIASLLLAGWSLHLDFLNQITAISRTVMLINLSMGFDGLLGQIFFLDQAIPLTGKSTLLILEKPDWWVWFTRLALLALIIGVTVWGWRNKELARQPLFWPFLFVCFSLLAPLSWSYYYLAPVAFAPLLLAYWGTPRGVAFLVLINFSVSLNVLKLVDYFPEFALPLQLSGTLGMAALALAFGLTLVHASKTLSKVS